MKDLVGKRITFTCENTSTCYILAGPNIVPCTNNNALYEVLDNNVPVYNDYYMINSSGNASVTLEFKNVFVKCGTANGADVFSEGFAWVPVQTDDRLKYIFNNIPQND